MSEALVCSSCNEPNELPEGKTFMFCAHCGKRIESGDSTKEEPLQWPKVLVSKKKREVPFDEMKSASILDEHMRTEGGYNIRRIRKELIGFEFYDSKGDWEFIPFEYEVVSDHNAILNLNGLGILDLTELQDHYSDEELDEIAHLDLSDNALKNLDFEAFYKLKNLKTLNLNNNKFKTFPLLWKDFDAHLASYNKHTLESINLSNNLIELNSGDKYPFYPQWDVLVSNNPFLSNLPTTVILGDAPNQTEHELSINLDGKVILNLTERGKEQQAQTEKRFADKRVERQKANRGGPCFIATAATGSYNHPDVLELRLFRDDWILNRIWGQAFVNWYYHYGAIAAKVIDKNGLLRLLSRWVVVKPLLYLSRILRSRF